MECNNLKKNKIIILLMLLIIGFSSCKNSEKELDKLKIAKQYYKVLDQSNVSEIEALLKDSLLTKETEYNYEQVFSLSDYIEWLKWDSVFEPEYKILQIKLEHDVVKATISKTDKRIMFLHEAPIVTNQIIRFDHNKITSIETVKYEVFNETTFVKNRTAFLSWIDENYPDLKGFIHDQTEHGGLNYLKAINLYQNRDNNLKHP